MKKGVEEKWFPEIEMPKNVFNNVDLGVFVSIITLILIAYLQWQTNSLYELIIRRIAGEW